MPDAEGMAKALREPLLKVFPPALLGRLVVIPYYPLNDEMIGAIARLQLGRIERRILENHKIPFTYDDDVVKLIAEPLHRAGERRPHDRRHPDQYRTAADQRGVPDANDGGAPIERVHVSVADGEFAYAFD